MGDDGAIHIAINAAFSDFTNGVADMDVFVANNSGKDIRRFMLAFPDARLRARSGNQKLEVTSDNRWGVSSISLKRRARIYSGENVEHMHVTLQGLSSNMNILRSTTTMDLPRNPGDLLGGMNIFSRATAVDGSNVPVILSLNTGYDVMPDTTF